MLPWFPFILFKALYKNNHEEMWIKLNANLWISFPLIIDPFSITFHFRSPFCTGKDCRICTQNMYTHVQQLIEGFFHFTHNMYIKIYTKQSYMLTFMISSNVQQETILVLVHVNSQILMRSNTDGHSMTTETFQWAYCW